MLGSAVQYNVPNLAGRSVGVAARLDKAVLPPSRRIVSLDERPLASSVDAKPPLP